jgi:tetratricopeptide (TPR) repeat protein
MKYKIGFFAFANLFSFRWWGCFYKYMKGIIRYTNGNYKESIKDFEYILQNGAFEPVISLVYENLGINYTRLNDFIKAEEYLTISRNYEDQQNNGCLFMWLGYIYLVKQQHEESLNCFRKARQFSDKPVSKWLVNRNYIQEQIESLEDDIKAKYKDVLTNN